MTGFLLGLLSGAIVGGAASFAKNPITKNPVRKDIQDAASTLSDSCDDIRATYASLQEERSVANENIDPETDDEVQVNHGSVKDKAADLVTAVKSVAKKNEQLDDLADRVQDLKDTATLKGYEVQDDVKDKLSDLKEKVSDLGKDDDNDQEEDNIFIQATTPEEDEAAQKEQSALADSNEFVTDDAEDANKEE